MSENEEPDWLAELVKGGDAVRRQVELLVQGAQQFVRDAQQGDSRGVGPVPPFQQRVVRAVGAAMRELAPASGHPVRYGSFKGHVGVTSSGSLALPTLRFLADADVVTATEAATVQVVPDRPDRPGRLAKFSNGEIVFLVLVWIYAVWLPLVGSRLPPELHGMLTDSYATVAIAMGITWRMLDKHK